MGDFKMGSKTVMSQSGTSNPTWGANAPTGAIMQTVFTLYSTYNVFGSATAAAASGSFNKSISVLSQTSLIFVQLMLAGSGKHSSNTRLEVRITESTTSLDIILSNVIGYTSDTSVSYSNNMCTYFHDHNQTVGTTLTYTPKFASTSGTANAGINNYTASDGDAKSYIILQEIAG